MASRNAKALDASRASGETPLRSGVALCLFGKVIAAMLSGSIAGRNLAICDVDWRRAPWVGMPLVSELLVPSPQAPCPQDLPFSRAQHLGRLPATDSATAPPESEDDGVRSFLSAYVHRWDESKPLVDLGLDSLDFARIKGDFARLFGRNVPLAAIAKPDQRLGDLYSLLSEHLTCG
jgi:hypothetical protein